MGNEVEIYRNEILAEFASYMPKIRKRLGLSQSELGAKVGLSRQSISSIERGGCSTNMEYSSGDRDDYAC